MYSVPSDFLCRRWSVIIHIFPTGFICFNTLYCILYCMPGVLAREIFANVCSSFLYCLQKGKTPDFQQIRRLDIMFPLLMGYLVTE